MRWRVALIVLAALAGAALTVVLVSRSGEEAAAPAPPRSIQGPQVQLGDLTYVVTNVRLLKRDRPADAPYLVNLQAPPKGREYFGVFLKVYNHNTHDDVPIAPGYLLEPSRAPGLVVQNQASESPYWLEMGGKVPAGGELPVPGSPAAAGPIEGGLLLYWVSGPMSKAQPFRLVINTGTQIGAIRLPLMPKLAGNVAH